MTGKVVGTITTTTGGMVAARTLMKLFPEIIRNMKEAEKETLSKPSTIQQLGRNIWLRVHEERNLCGIMLDLTRMYEARLLVKKAGGFYVPLGVRLALKYVD